MTLGSLWQLFERETKGWMVGGTVAVLAGVAIGLAPEIASGATGFPRGGHAGLELLLPSLFLSLGGGYAVLFPGLQVGRGRVRLVRDWKLSPLSGRLLWALSLATAVAGLAACILAGATDPAFAGLLVWLFMGPYLALAGWAAALLGMAANIRAIGAADGHAALATHSG